MGIGTFFLLTLVTHAEQRSLKYVYMSLPYQLGEELQEECYHEQTNVHTVHIGIGRNDYLVVAKVIQTLLDIQGSLQQVELLVLIDHLLGKAVAVQGLTAKTEYSLSVHVTALGD